MPGPTPQHPEEFKQEAVKLYRSSGRSFSEVSSELGISEESLSSTLAICRWKG